MSRKRTVGGGPIKAGFGGGYGSGGVSAFIALSDVPHTYGSQGGKVVVVKGDESGLEFNTEMAIDRHDVIITATDTDPQFLNDKLLGDMTGVSYAGYMRGIKTKYIIAESGSEYLIIQATEDPVIDFFDNTAALPVTPVVGDRYIALVTANGWIKDNVYEWEDAINGGVAAWSEFIPYTGMTCYAGMDIGTGHKQLYSYDDGTGWTQKTYLLDYTTIILNGSGELSVKNLDVVSIFDNTAALPVFPSTGDRHIALVTANGWTINNIYEYNGLTWDETVVYDGMKVVVKSYSNIYSTIGRLFIYAYAGSMVYSWKPVLSGQAGEIVDFPAKSAPVAADVLLIEDSEDNNKKKNVTISNLPIIVSAANASEEAAAFARGAIMVIRTDLI